MSTRESQPLPPYTFVPGGPWPHPRSNPAGHLWGKAEPPATPIQEDRWADSGPYLRGIELFNAGYYWEAHEAWESLWHAHQRRGPAAEVLKGLIKLAAAGVKVLEGRPAGVRTLAAGAAHLFRQARQAGGRFQLGLDLEECARQALGVSENPPTSPISPGGPPTRVLPIRLEPR